MMRRLWIISQTEMKLVLRNFMTVFFALVFPIIMMAMFGGVYGNEPSEHMGGYGAIDIMTPSYICLIVAVTGIMSLPLTIAEYREKRILKRFMASPISPRDILLTQVLVNFITTIAGMILLIVFTVATFGLQFNGNITYTVFAFILTALSIFSLGLLIAGVSPNGRAASAISYIVYFPMMFLSGSSMPTEIMPDAIKTISKALPLTYGVNLMKGMWLGKELSGFILEIAVLAGVLVICTVISIRCFKWE